MKFFNRQELRNDELDAEVASHLAMAQRDLIATGLSPAEARAVSLREFGNVSHIKQTTREMWGWNLLEDLKFDVKYAARALNRTRSFTITAIATLALGISAATVIFSVADHVVLRPLPYPDANRLFVISERITEMREQYPNIPANVSHFLEWKRLCAECEDMAAMRQGGLLYTGSGDAELVGTIRATSNMLPLLGARFLLGRVFTAAEDNAANGNVVVLSNAYWRRKFGSDTAIVGKSISFNGSSRQVIGVLAPEFIAPKGNELNAVGKLPNNVEAFVPLVLSEQERTTDGNFDYIVVAKLKPTATLQQAHARLVSLQTAITTRRQDKLTVEVITAPMQALMVGASGQALLILLAAVGAILLIVCVNLTNLSLARQASRIREAAVRMALGARQGRLVRQALTESVMIALIGGTLGVVLSRWGLQLLLHFAPADFPRIAEVQLDLRVLAVAGAVSVLTGVLFGVLPALRYGRVEPGNVLAHNTRSMTDGRSALRTLAFLIASQIGLSATLLYATGLFLTSFLRVLQVDKGFSDEQMLALDIALPRSVYSQPESRVGFYDEVLPKLAALPGVRAVGVTSLLPLEGENQVDALSRENDQRASAERPLANIRQVDPGYFASLGVNARRGRLLSASDRGRNVVVLSERAAATLWPGEDPIGKRMVPGNGPLSEVIGTVSDVRTSNIERVGSMMAYVPYWHRAPLESTLLLNTTLDASQFAAAARSVIHSVGKTIPVSRVRTLDQIVTSAVAGRRFQLLLLLLFAGSAVVIASIGIYGVISHSLVKRSNEIGVRMALGAERSVIHRLVVAEMLKPVVLGLSSGIVFSLMLGQLFRALLFEVNPVNFPTLITVSAVLLLVALVACLIPARRATRGGALMALRAE
ncbi:MAG: ABC transporter permease [Gemmatimonadaceae bacterium]